MSSPTTTSTTSPTPTPTPTPTPKPVYICGYSLRLAGSNSPSELHTNLLNKVNAVQVDVSRFPTSEFSVPKYASLAQDITMMDHAFFGVNGGQAEKLDPQIYLLLETSFEALLDSGLTPDDVNNTETGVYVGACFSDMHSFQLSSPATMSGYEHTGCAKAMFSNRLSYSYNLHGPSVTIDTACSSSLVAMTNAYKDLQSGRVTTALVGGSSLILDPSGCIGFDRFHMLAPDGHCKSFDKSGDGFARADGIVCMFLTTDPAFVRLKPLACVRAAETNTCGAHAKGITYPSGEQQCKLYERAFVNIDRTNVDYIEAHGTGTKAGDHEELTGIRTFFGDRPSLSVGSIKSNVGHSEGCSGLAGLSKVLLMLENKSFYPQLHLQDHHDDVGLLTIHKEYAPVSSFADPSTGVVPLETHERLAVVCSYGFGGANAVVVVSSCDDDLLKQLKPLLSSSSSSLSTNVLANNAAALAFPELAFLSHRTAAGLAAFASKLPPQHQPVYSHDVRRFPHRGVAGLLAADAADPPEPINSTRPVYLLFTGNGSQWSGMGAELLANPAFADLMTSCGAHIPALLRALPDSALLRVEALSALQIGLTSILQSYNIPIAGFIGHSAGEIAASFASGATDVSTTMAIARARGMNAQAFSTLSSTEGGMAAAACDAATVEPLLAGTSVIVGCYNTPSSVTLSGSLADLKHVTSLLKAAGVKCKILDTAGVPYHNNVLLQPGAAQLESDLKKCVPTPKPFPPTWISAVRDADTAAGFTARYHLDSVMNPVDFAAALPLIPKNAILVEVGPHSILRSYVAEVLPECIYIPMMLLNKPADQTVPAAIAAIWKSGGSVRQQPTPARLPLDVRPFAASWERKEFDLVDWSMVRSPNASNSSSSSNSSSGRSFEFDLIGEDAYLRDHAIDGRPLFPATGYVWVIVETFGKLPCAVERFKILRPVTLSEDFVELKVSILITGECAVMYNGEVVASAWIGAVDQQSTSSSSSRLQLCPTDAESQTPKMSMESQTFYRHAANSGYEYDTAFRGLKTLSIPSDTNVTRGFVESNHAIPFLDSMLQLSLLRTLGDGLRLPTEIRRIEFQLPVPASSWAVHDRYLNRVTCGAVTIDGLETSLASRQAKPESIAFTKADLLVIGEEGEAQPSPAYLTNVLRFGAALLRSTSQYSENAQRVLAIIDTFDPAARKAGYDYEELVSHKDNELFQLFTDSFASGGFSANSAEASSLLETLVTNMTILNPNDAFLQKCFSVTRAHTKGNLLNVFEVGTGTGSFLKLVAPYLHPRDELAISDDADASRFVFDETTPSLPPLEFHSYDTNKAPSSAVTSALSKTDILVAHKSLSKSKKLDAAIRTLSDSLAADAFAFVHECTSPIFLPVCGMLSDEEHNCFTSFNEEGGDDATTTSRSFGRWLSVEEWLEKFRAANLELISLSTDSMSTSFFLRKVAAASAAPRYTVVPILAFDSLPALPTTPTLYVAPRWTGIHGFVRSVNREGFDTLSLELAADNMSSASKEILDTCQRLRLQTCVITSDNKLATHAHVSMPSKMRRIDAAVPAHVEFHTPGDLTSGVLVQTAPRISDSGNGVPLPLIKISFAALNFRDVMLASNKINKDSYLGFSRKGSGVGLEFSGLDVATNVRVMGFGLEALGNYIQSDFTWPIPDNMSLEEGATLPVVYLTVYYCFYRAKLDKGDSVLIHAGTGGVGQAAIRVAHSLGVEIFTTCNASKRSGLKAMFPFLLDSHIGDSRSLQFEDMVMTQTRGRGVTAVLNSLSDEKLQASFRCVKQHGYFLEIGKYDLSTNAKLGMKKFLSNATFCGIDVDQVFEQPKEMRTISKLFTDGLASGVVQPLNSTIYPYSKVVDAMKFLASGKHTGKVLIDMDGVGETVPFEAKYYTQGTHIITGGLGGFAMVLAKWLAEKGATKIVLATRRGICNGEHFSFVQSVKDKFDNVCVEVITDDLTNEKVVKELASKIGPVRGVWHLAMVLNDVMLKDMTESQWIETVKTKTAMGQLLSTHVATNSDCSFACFSSISSRNGNAGQTNYAYTNNELEQLCAYRAEKLGLPATCVQWGAIDNVGVVAQHKNAAVFFSSLTDAVGVGAQSAKSCLAHLEAALVSGAPVVASYRQADRAVSTTAAGESSGASAGAPAAVNLLQVIGKILQVDLKPLSHEVLLSEVGLDSLSSAVAHAALCRAIGETFPLNEMSKMTVGKLHALQGKVKVAGGAAGAAAAGEGEKKSRKKGKPTASVLSAASGSGGGGATAAATATTAVVVSQSSSLLFLEVESEKVSAVYGGEPASLSSRVPGFFYPSPETDANHPTTFVRHPESIDVTMAVPAERFTKSQLHFSLLHSCVAVVLNLGAARFGLNPSLGLWLSLAYVAADTFIDRKKIFQDGPQLGHHVGFALAAMYCLFVAGESDSKNTAMLIGTFELSTILYNLFHLHKDDSLFLMFGVAFFITRVMHGATVLGPMAVRFLIEANATALLLTVFTYGLQLYWMRGIWKVMRRKSALYKTWSTLVAPVRVALGAVGGVGGGTIAAALGHHHINPMVGLLVGATFGFGSVNTGRRTLIRKQFNYVVEKIMNSVNGRK